MNFTNKILTKRSQTQNNTLWFYLCKIQKQVKLKNGVRNYDSVNIWKDAVGEATKDSEVLLIFGFVV